MEVFVAPKVVDVAAGWMLKAGTDRVNPGVVEGWVCVVDWPNREVEGCAVVDAPNPAKPLVAVVAGFENKLVEVCAVVD